MSTPKPLQRIIQADQRLRRASAFLRNKKTIAIVSVDLVGSTSLKQRYEQAIWLPFISAFILAVKAEADHVRGEVLKYIGDEVLVTFSPEQCEKGTVEQFVRNVVHSFRNQPVSEIGVHEAKFAVDYG